MVAIAAIVVWLFVGVIGSGLAAWFVFRFWKRSKQTPLAAKLIASVAVASAVAAAVGTLVGLVKAFGAVGGESVDPSQKARILAHGISEAMNCAAFGLAVWLPSIIVTLVITRARKDHSP